MALSSISNVAMTGLAACVPKHEVSNLECDLFTQDEARVLVKTTGIERRRTSASDLCASDLCFESAEKLLQVSGTAREEIEALVLVTQYPDFPLPATSPILQSRLSLPKSCLTADLVLGCSGYVYGLSVISSLVSAMKLKKGLLLVGDAISKVVSGRDRSTMPLFGDAGTATLLEYNESAAPIKFDLGSDGSGHSAIIVPHGGLGSRHPADKESFDYEQLEGGISRNKCQLILDGVEVFNFSLREPVQSVRQLMERFQHKIEDFDAFFFHQANLSMNELIRKKLKIPETKHPYSLKDFGNTSCASIPLTMVTKYRQELESRKNRLLLCGFGVGLSWGSLILETEKITCPELIEL
jgi:3-oxoacyl-[acyl-carrier-protein] synthase-3